MKKFMSKLNIIYCSLFLCLTTLPVHGAEHGQDQAMEITKILDLKMAVKAAQLNDPWLVGNKHSQDAVLSMSVAAGSLPDPKMSIGLANLASDSFNFGQEDMTQAKVGISQMFPPGDSLDIRKRQLELQSSQFPYQRQDRRAKIAVTVGQLWLNAYKAQESIVLIEKSRGLFIQLVDIAEAGYTSTLGKGRQQDMIRAQLELTLLDDRLTLLHQRREMFQQRLSEWLNGYFGGNFRDRYDDRPGFDPQATPETTPDTTHGNFALVAKMPDLNLLKPHLYVSSAQTKPERLFENLAGHPALKAIDQKIKTSSAGIDLAKQSYKPEWGVNAGYGYRASNALGKDRSDLLSVGVTFSLPLFTANRQDKVVQSARSRTSAVKTEKWQLLRKLMASFETAKAQLLRLDQRQKLYQTELLPQIHEQAEASLIAYTNDEGDFSEVVRARIAEMEAEIVALGIAVDKQKTILQLNYFFMTEADDMILSEDTSGEKK